MWSEQEPGSAFASQCLNTLLQQERILLSKANPTHAVWHIGLVNKAKLPAPVKNDPYLAGDGDDFFLTQLTTKHDVPSFNMWE